MSGLSKAIPPDKLLEGFRTRDFGKAIEEAFGPVASERATRLLHVVEGIEAEGIGPTPSEWRVALVCKLRRELLEAIGDFTRLEGREG